MQSSDSGTIARLIDSGDNRQSLLLLVGAVFAALLTGAISGFFGGIAALLSLLVVLFMIVAIADYRAGIWVAIVLLPLSATRLIPRELFGITGLNPLNLTLLMTTVSLLFMCCFRRAEFAVPKFPRQLWIYVTVLALGTLHGISHVHSIPPFFRALDLISFDGVVGYVRDIFLKPVIILATAAMLAIAVRNTRRSGMYLVLILCSSLILPFAVIGYVAVSGESLAALASSRNRDTLSVTGMHANELGMMFNMAFALMLFSFAGMSGGLKKWIAGVALAVLVVAITLTFSRGAFLGFVAVVMYFLHVQRRLSIVMFASLLIPAAILVVPQAVVERLTTGVHDRNIETLSAGRVDNIWLPLLPEVAGSPIFGHGLSSILWSEPMQRGTVLKVGHPHNAYLGVLLDLGLLGAALIALFFRHMCRLFAELARRSTEPIWQGFFQGANGCIVVLLVQGLTDDRFTPTFSQTYLWLSYGIAMGLASVASNTEKRGGAADAKSC